MITKQNLKKISEYLYEIPASFRKDMKVPARIYADEKLLEKILEDKSLEQAVNVATLPGIQKYALAMPDIHQGYGFPIGGVAAIETKNGVISPGGIGYDINCGVRLLASEVSKKELAPHLEDLIEILFATIPTGVGSRGKLKVKGNELDEVLEKGAEWAAKKGFGSREDLNYIEAAGKLEWADPSKVSDTAKKRGSDQIGTLGSGNHFLEVQYVEQIFNEELGRAFGLFPGQITVMIHTGSRGLGHQTCTDYIRKFHNSLSKFKIRLPDPELIYVPFESKEGQDYFGAMAAAANFAWTNRQYLMYLTREVWQNFLAGKLKTDLRLIYDVAHNIAKIEEYEIDGKRTKVCVHRKGATRAFGPQNPETPEIYKNLGQPVIIPGSMGTASYLLVGTKKAEEESFGSVCHGAGRVMSRKKAKMMIRGTELQKELEMKGIYARTYSMPGLAEEAPQAYKDIDKVINVVTGAGLAQKVARLKPMGVIKG